MSRSTVIYFDAGENCLGVHDLTRTERREFDTKAMEEGHVGYLSGYHQNWSGETDTVIVYFKKRPKWSEIMRRRNNGFKAAQWHPLNLSRKYLFVAWLDDMLDEAKRNRHFNVSDENSVIYYNGRVSAFGDAIEYIKGLENEPWR